MRKIINKLLGRIIAAVLSCVLFVYAFSHGFIYASEVIEGNEIKQEEANIDEVRNEIIHKAVEYLSKNVGADGCYREGYSYNTTSEVCFVLDEYSDVDTAKSVEWLKAQDFDNNTDSLSRYIIASNDDEYLDGIFKGQNRDGGFGLTGEFQSDIPDTLLVLEAANRTADHKYAGSLKRISNYLTHECHQNGAYSFVKGGEEEAIISSRALYDLIVYRENYSDESSLLLSSINKTINYIENDYKADFSADEIEKSLYEAIALRKAGVDVDFEDAVRKLQSIQKDDGSFYDSYHLTALVIWFLGEAYEPAPILTSGYQNQSYIKTTDEVVQSETITVTNSVDEQSVDTNDALDAKDDDNTPEINERVNASSGDKDDETYKDVESVNNDVVAGKETTNNSIDNTVKVDEDKATEKSDKAPVKDSNTVITDNPKTSDSFSYIPVLLFVVSGIMIVVLLVLKKKNKSVFRKTLSLLLACAVVMTSFSSVRASNDSSAIEEQKGQSAEDKYADDPVSGSDAQEFNKVLDEVETPLDIYNFVRRNISSEHGLKGTKSVESVLKEKRATASENTILLGELLKSKGYKVQYVLGNALLTEEQLMYLAGGETLSEAKRTYNELGMDITEIEQEDGSALFVVPHIWIRAYIPVTDYRCAGNNGGRYEWVELDAYVKNPKLDEVDELGLIPLSLPYETEGLTEGADPAIYEVIPDDIYNVSVESTNETTGDDTTDDVPSADDNNTSVEDATPGDPENGENNNDDDVTPDEPTDPTNDNHANNDPSNDNHANNDPSNDNPTDDDPSVEDPSVKGFFKTFDTKDEFVTGDGEIVVSGKTINSNSLFSTVALDQNEYGLKYGKDEAGVTLKKYENTYLTWGSQYYYPDFDVYQALDTKLNQQNGTYKGEYRLIFETHKQPDNLDFYEDHVYAVSSEICTWNDAKEACEEMGGHLVIIDNAEENAYVRDLVNATGNDGYTAIGYSDSDNEGRWNWVAPTDSTYTGWHEGEPNDGGNYVSGGQDYAFMYSDGTWDDGADGFHYYVCEWETIEAVASYELSTLMLVMEVSDDLELDLEESSDVMISNLNDGFKQYIIKLDLDKNKRFTIPAEVDKEKAYSTLIRNVNLFYSVGTSEKDERLGDINLENTNYAEEGLWSAVIDSGTEGAVWSYLDIDALYDTSSYLIVCAAASDDVSEAAYYRYGDGRRIYEDEAYSENGLQDMVGRYLCLSIYVEPGIQMEVPFINSVTVGADTDARPVLKAKEYPEISIEGDDVIDIDSISTYKFSVITTQRNADDVVWCVDGKEAVLREDRSTFMYPFSADEEGEYTLRAYFRDDPEHYAEKKVTVVRAEDHDAKQVVNEFLKYPYFNMYLDKTAYYDGEDIKVITDIPDQADVIVLFDQEAYEVTLTDGCFTIDDVRTGNHTINVLIKNKSGNKFSKTITVNVYDAAATVRTWFDKERYFSGDDVILFVEDGYRFVGAAIDGKHSIQADNQNNESENKILEIADNGASVTFYKPSTGNHILDVKLIKKNPGEESNGEAETENEDEISLKIYLFINSAQISSDLDDVVTLYDDDDKEPEVEIVSPGAETEMTGVVPIICTVKDETKLNEYNINRCKLDENGEIVSSYTVCEGTEDIEQKTVGELDMDQLAEGTYKIVLEATDMAGNSSSAEVIFNVTKTVTEDPNNPGTDDPENPNPDDPNPDDPSLDDPDDPGLDEPESPDDTDPLRIGNMHIGFNDLSENIGKARISVNRIYDSRNKRRGDFGYGWSLDTSGMKLFENHPITDGYSMSISGSAFNMTYQLYETVSHDVTISYGDGSSDRFTLYINGGTSALTPVDEVSFSYICTTDPKLTLEILADTTAYYDNGELLFEDEDIYDEYDFRLTDGDGNRYYLSKASGVYRIEDNYGRTINIDKTGYHGTDGKGITFTRDSRGRITAVTNDEGKTVAYTYDKNGDLIKVTDIAGRTVQFTYDSDHNLISIIDTEGHTVARNEYDNDGLLIATIDADGNRTEYSHNVDGREEIITDRLGNKTLYVYDEKGNIISKTDANGNITETTYDEYGNILTYKDAEGNVTVSSYDASGNLTSVTDAEGNSISVEYDAANRPVKLVTVDDAVMKIAYDSKGEITETTDVDGSVISYERDADGNVKSITDEIGKVMSSEYDSLGRVIATTDAAGNRVEYTYDSEGHKLTETYTVTTSDGEVSRTIKYNYNDAGELISTEDPDGHISTIERNNLGQTTAIIDSEGRRTSYEYDKLGNTTKISYPDGTSESFVYDAEDNLTSATGRSGNTAEYTYDKVGNLKKIHDARGNDTLYDYDRNYNLTAVTYATGAKISYKYDSLNRNTEVTDNDENTTYFTYDSRSLLTSVTDAKGNVTRYEYNTKGERIKVIYPDETSASIELDVRGRVTAKIDTAGNRTEYTYDGSDRLISVKQPDGSVTEFTYDKTGNLLSFKDAKGRMTRYEYDDHQRVVKTTLPDGSYSTVSYDVFGYLVKATDPDGSVLVYGYDELGRPESVTKSGTRNAQNVSEKIEYSYDDYGRIIGITDTKTGIAGFDDINESNGENGVGAASTSDNIVSSSVTYTYDEYGCITNKTYDNGQKVSYGYDDYGRCTGVSVTSAGTTLTTGYEYDSMDRLTRVISHDGKATVYTYDENGNRSTATYANGVTLTYTYDECNRLKVERVTDKNQNLISQYEYTTENGERTAVKESYPDGTVIETEYSYDSCGRLLSEKTTEKKSGNTSVTDIKYTYDLVGSRTSKTVNGITTEYDYNVLNQLINETTNADSSVSQIEYIYDSNGNLIRTVSDSKNCGYSYDLFDRMTGFTDGTVSYSYSYDAEGVRRSKTRHDDSGSETVMYVSDTLTEYSQTLAETDETGNIKTDYTVGFELISNTNFCQDASAASYYILDGHNDVRMLLDDSASVRSSFRYSAYGEMLDFTGGITDGYYYTGEYMDSETGLYNLRARYMNPETASFTTMDRYAGNIYDPASLHRYLYANANPVKYCDPSGHSPLATLTVAVSQLSMLQTYKIIGAMALFSGLINAGTSALRTVYNNVFYGAEESVNITDLLKEFTIGFAGGWLLGSIAIIASLLANATLLQMYIALTGISVVIGVIQTVIAACKGDEFGVALSAIFTTLSLIAFGNLYSYNKSISVKSSEGIEQTIEVDAAGENIEVKSESNVVDETPQAGEAGVETSYGKSSANLAKPKGWKVGDPIDNLTRTGKEPAWSTVRSRYWKNEAYYNSGNYSKTNIARMQKGKAPIDIETGASMELHHINGRNIENPHSIDNLQKVWPWQHDEIDPYRHYNGPRPEGE